MTKLTVTTSRAQSSERKAVFEKEWRKKYGEITVEYHIDDAIIGGIIVFDGNKVYDGSVSSKLNEIKNKLSVDYE